jgi:replicative DNA helicase
MSLMSDVEASALGAVLIRPEYWPALSRLGAHHWSSAANRLVFMAMRRLALRDESIDLLTVKAELELTDDLDSVGGPAYIAALTDGVPRDCDVENYAKVIAGTAE